MFFILNIIVRHPKSNTARRFPEWTPSSQTSAFLFSCSFLLITCSTSIFPEIAKTNTLYSTRPLESRWRAIGKSARVVTKPIGLDTPRQRRAVDYGWNTVRDIVHALPTSACKVWLHLFWNIRQSDLKEDTPLIVSWENCGDGCKSLVHWLSDDKQVCTVYN